MSERFPSTSNTEQLTTWQESRETRREKVVELMEYYQLPTKQCEEFEPHELKEHIASLENLIEFLSFDKDSGEVQNHNRYVVRALSLRLARAKKMSEAYEIPDPVAVEA